MSNIHQTAVIDNNAKIHESVKVGPYCVIGPGVSIGKDCILKSHVVVNGPTKIGSNNEFFSFSIIVILTDLFKFLKVLAALKPPQPAPTITTCAFFAALKLFIGIKVDEKRIDDFRNVLLLIIFNSLFITKIFC